MSFKLCLLHEISVLADIAFMVPTLTNNIHCLTLRSVKSNRTESDCCVGSHTALALVSSLLPGEEGCYFLQTVELERLGAGPLLGQTRPVGGNLVAITLGTTHSGGHTAWTALAAWHLDTSCSLVSSEITTTLGLSSVL